MRTSLLGTDGYKFSMAEAGAPLRRETFYYSHRRGGAGGWHYMPLDVEPFIRSVLPRPTAEDYAFLDLHGYTTGGAFRKAMSYPGLIRVDAVPCGAWFYDREPAFSVTGPSAIASWLEPSALQLSFRIQIATRAMSGMLGPSMKVTCERERDIILETLAALPPSASTIRRVDVAVATDEYRADVARRVRHLLEVVHDPDRIFEVGMRAVSCQEQHMIALEVIRDLGIRRTSNVLAASELGMIPVGTMGHEHVQRYGRDYDAYAAMRDRHPGFIFYLPDTFDTIGSGIPAAIRAMLDDPSRESGIRFDSEHGIRGHYLYAVTRFREADLEKTLALESGWNLELTREFEELREQVRWPAERQCYGFGGFLVKPEWPHIRRDDVSAVYKLSQTGATATMKFGDEPGGGKESIPGRPVIFRTHDPNGPAGYVLQEGEDWTLHGATRLTNSKAWGGAARPPERRGPSELSPATAALRAECVANRDWSRR